MRFLSYHTYNNKQSVPSICCATASLDSGVMTTVPLGKTVLAMFGGISTVCAGTVAANYLDTSDPPQFGLSYSGVSRYDQSTLIGRYKQMFFACDPLLLLHSDDSFREAAAVLAKAKACYEEQPNLQQTPEQNRRLWNLKRMVDSAMPNPDNGEVVPAPFRMSGYVPFNGPICVAMVASTSTFGLLFWAWANQSQNALVNYYNRNASSTMSNETLAKSYGLAVGTALSVGFVLSTVVKKKFPPQKANQLLKFVAFPSSVLASSLNCYIVRSPEISSGVPLLHPDTLKDVLPGETSSVAAKKGVHETTASRAILQVPVYFLPPLLTSTLFSPVLAANPALSVPLTTYLLVVSFGFGLPLAIAMFPQYGEVAAQEVEEKFRAVTDATGAAIKSFKYNKGL